MREFLAQIRTTTPSKPVGVIRLVVGGIFLMTGVMKLAVPVLGEAFAGQLEQAHIPLVALNQWLVPIVEILLGTFLILGFVSRLLSLVAIVIMLVATYVHLVVQDPALFPLQPKEPVIPIVVMGLCIYLIWRGSGAWSLDLRPRVVPTE